MTLTKEWLLRTIAELEEERDSMPGVVNEDAARALAAMKIALASLEAEAVAEVCEGFTLRYIGHGPAPKSWVRIGDRLYAAPPAPVSVPDGYRLQPISEYDAMCAAMLQGADGNAPAHFRSRPAQSSLSPAQGGNSPVIPDGWVACRERMPEAGDDMIVFTDDIVMSGISYSKKKGFYIQALEYDDDEPVDNVTHWMPLPAAPQHK